MQDDSCDIERSQNAATKRRTPQVCERIPTDLFAWAGGTDAEVTC
jgi:hypothetical protein